MELATTRLRGGGGTEMRADCTDGFAALGGGSSGDIRSERP